MQRVSERNEDIPELMREQYDIYLMTYEKFSALALGAPHILNQVGTVIIDEVQMIADESRGVKLEFRKQGIVRFRLSLAIQMVCSAGWAHGCYEGMRDLFLSMNVYCWLMDYSVT